MGKQQDANAAKAEFSAATHSDHLAVVHAFDGWQRVRAQPSERGGSSGGGGRQRSAETEYCWQNFVSFSTLREMEQTRRQLFDLLRVAGFVPREAHLDQHHRHHHRSNGGGADAQPPVSSFEYERHVGNASLVKCVLCAALYPSVALIAAPSQNSHGRSGKRPRIFTRNTGEVQIHPSSVNRQMDSRDLKGYVIFLEQVQTSQVFLRDTTAISHFPLLLFGGTALRINHSSGGITIMECDGSHWLEFRATAKIGMLFKLLREELDRLLMLKIEEPESSVSEHGATAVSAVLQLLAAEEREYESY